ncbi:MAG TPA: ATP-dependent DNA ligase [Devosia sp.]|nr:ATP-dependent DNA ligase [Devosia sp.]
MPETSPLDPMEARLVDALPAGEGWTFEPKWDGFRCLALKEGGAVRLFAKSGKPLGRYFPDMVAALEALAADNFLLDGERVIPVGASLSFDALQMRLHPAESRVRKLAAETPALLVLFDLLVADGASIAAQPLSTRRAALERFVAGAPSPSLRLSPATDDPATARGWLARAGGAIDGVVAKRLDQPYQPGERAMLKVKNIRTADCVVGGFRYASGSRLLGSLLLGLYDAAGRLDHVGFTSALAGEDKAALTARLEALRGEGFTGNAPGGPSRWSTEKTSDYVPLRHELVVEVSYDHVTGARFRHGTGLRRWRPDKAPRQCTYDQLQLGAPPSAPVQAVLSAQP